MRKLIPLLAATILPLGAFDIPKGFFNLSELEDARAEAAEKPEMIGFLITNPKLQPS